MLARDLSGLCSVVGRVTGYGIVPGGTSAFTRACKSKNSSALLGSPLNQSCSVAASVAMRPNARSSFRQSSSDSPNGCATLRRYDASLRVHRAHDDSCSQRETLGRDEPSADGRSREGIVSQPALNGAFPQGRWSRAPKTSDRGTVRRANAVVNFVVTRRGPRPTARRRGASSLERRAHSLLRSRDYAAAAIPSRPIIEHLRVRLWPVMQVNARAATNLFAVRARLPNPTLRRLSSTRRCPPATKKRGTAGSQTMPPRPVITAVNACTRRSVMDRAINVATMPPSGRCRGHRHGRWTHP